MSPDIQRNPDNTITVSFTFTPGASMLESELNLQTASNDANALASGECLKRFDTDGSPIEMGGRTLTSKGQAEKTYQPTNLPMALFPCPVTSIRALGVARLIVLWRLLHDLCTQPPLFLPSRQPSNSVS